MDEEAGSEGGVGGTGGSNDSDDFDMESAISDISKDLFPSDEKDESEEDDLEGVKVDGEEDANKSEGDGTEKKDDKDESKPDGAEGNTSQSQAPNTWKKEVAAEWDKIPEVARQEILRREQEIHQGIEGYKVAASVGDTFYQIAKDYTQNIESRGIKPLDMVASFFNIEHTLANGSMDQKVEVLQKIAAEYGIILDGNGNYTFQDDSVMELKKEVQTLKQQENDRLARSQTETKEKISNEINQFASDPANTHFNTVANEMVVLLSANKNMTLKEAYDKAVWMNPTTRALEIAKENKKIQDEAEAKRKEEVAKAKKLSSVNLSKTNGDAKKGKVTGSWEDNLAKSYDDIVSRA